ncbi:MAG TPA: outer membrane protein assembly factor BamD [Spirochaetota bacterium]|nr:outer membrane protein assembly factor BamD [Spirochaetota bacterium]HPJ37978.1 outer membrane protein assembly factor BamD [Spirochaetota bacterium]HPQ52282.1 outer membrane protein assembly factor BamD [Spirochaetota bacterium]
MKVNHTNRGLCACILISLCILLPALQLPGQNQAQEEDLAKIADDLKFENGRHFYDMKLYDKSLRELHEYLEIYINGLHRKEALWTIGSIYFKRFDYPRAVKSYKSLYEEFSTSEEGIKAYYHTGICYMKMGFSEKAEKVFSTIMEDHPDSPYSSQSRTQITLIRIMGSGSEKTSPPPEKEQSENSAPAAAETNQENTQ